MRLFYADESGDLGEERGTPLFLLGGVAVEDNNWHKLDWAFDKAVLKFLGRDSDGLRTELHSSNVRTGRGDPYRSMPRRKRHECLKAAFSVLQEHNKCFRAFIVVVDKRGLRFPESSHKTIRYLAACRLRAAFREYMVWHQASQNGRRERGMLIWDHQGREKKLETQFMFLHGEETKHEDHMLIESALFKNSQTSRLIQAADLICHFAYRLFAGNGRDFGAEIWSFLAGYQQSEIVFSPPGFQYIAIDPATCDRYAVEVSGLPLNERTGLPAHTYIHPENIKEPPCPGA